MVKWSTCLYCLYVCSTSLLLFLNNKLHNYSSHNSIHSILRLDVQLHGVHVTKWPVTVSVGRRNDWWTWANDEPVWGCLHHFHTKTICIFMYTFRSFSFSVWWVQSTIGIIVWMLFMLFVFLFMFFSCITLSYCIPFDYGIGIIGCLCEICEYVLFDYI